MAQQKQDALQVCLNGHIITDSYHRLPNTRRDKCEQCGAPTLKDCPHCGKEIKGAYHGHLGSIPYLIPTPPDQCECCGKDLPWKEKPIPPTQDDITWQKLEELSRLIRKNSEELLEKVCHQVNQALAVALNSLPLQETIRAALDHLYKARFDLYFAEMDKVVPAYSDLMMSYNDHKLVFTNGNPDVYYPQKLVIFARQVNAFLTKP